MRSLAIGSIVAAIVMFALGFVFFGLLGMQAYDPVAPEAAAAVQGALASSLAQSGSYMIPPDEAAWMVDHHALVNYVAAGDSPSMASAMIGGFLHFLITACLLGFGLQAVGGDAGRRIRVALWLGLAASVLMHLGDPIWYGFGWRYSLFLFVADGVILIAGGLVIAKWFTGGAAAPASD